MASSYFSSLMKEQAEAAGRALASFWVVRHHLWLSQCQLQQRDQDCLLKVPVKPTVMFGPDAAKLLQQAQESQCRTQDISGSLSRHSNSSRWATISVPQPTPEMSPWGLEDQLEAFHRYNGRQGKKGDSAAQA